MRAAAPITAAEFNRELVTVVGMIRRLSPPLSQRPEHFHEQKDALARHVELLRDRAFGTSPVHQLSFSEPTRDTGISSIRQGRRLIPVERRRCR